MVIGIPSQLSHLSKALDHYSQIYNNLLIIGDFNSEMSEISMSEFCVIYNLKYLVKEKKLFLNFMN